MIGMAYPILEQHTQLKIKQQQESLVPRDKPYVFTKTSSLLRWEIAEIIGSACVSCYLPIDQLCT